MNTDAVKAVAEATRWEKHGIRYGDDDCLDCMCGWSATGHPDRVELYRLHQAEAAVAAAEPFVRAQIVAEIQAHRHPDEPDFPSMWWEGYYEAKADAARVARGDP